MPDASSIHLVLTPDQARARLITRGDMVPCEVAFIDCKMPGSEAKQNYALVGPGVTQSHDQVVNLTEAHGFSLGVAAMPPGTVNNLHIHFTAEVFMIQRGTWTFRWGADGTDGEIVGHPGDVISIPTWIFRGFTNSGDQDGWIFTALGGDDTGGIIWHPSILETAARFGMYLTTDNMLVDTGAGHPKPEPASRMPPLTAREIDGLPRYSQADMVRRVVQAGQRDWSERALLDSVLPGHRAALAPVLGHGMTEDRAHAAPITNPHGFSIEWLRIEPGQQVGQHALAEKQVVIVFGGALDIRLNGDLNPLDVHVGTGEVFSIPADAWRCLAASPGAPMEAALLTAGDARKRITWCAEIVHQALEAGVVLDHDGHVAPLALLPPPTRRAARALLLATA